MLDGWMRPFFFIPKNRNGYLTSLLIKKKKNVALYLHFSKVFRFCLQAYFIFLTNDSSLFWYQRSLLVRILPLYLETQCQSMATVVLAALLIRKMVQCLIFVTVVLYKCLN